MKRKRSPVEYWGTLHWVPGAKKVDGRIVLPAAPRGMTVTAACGRWGNDVIADLRRSRVTCSDCRAAMMARPKMEPVFRYLLHRQEGDKPPLAKPKPKRAPLDILPVPWKERARAWAWATGRTL